MIQAIAYHAETGLALFLISVALASHRLVPIETLYVREINPSRFQRLNPLRLVPLIRHNPARCTSDCLHEHLTLQRRAAGVPGGGLLVGVGGAEDGFFVEGAAR